MNSIKLIPIKDLEGLEFFIPEYQRGYRWKTRQVLDLLEDLQEFMGRSTDDDFYCLQPLVVMGGNENWIVVDGQQRLTTLYILLKVLGLNDNDLYHIKYETRPDSASFLKTIDPSNAKEHIDYLHVYNSYLQIKKWFEENQSIKDDFKSIILNRTEFIWYECDDNEDPIDVFTRLNIGKISLTNSELVKALFLSSSNFTADDIRQKEIAVSWDRMEYALQKDEFWCFIHEDGYDQPTRIDFILELLIKLKNDTSATWTVNRKDLGDDHFSIFRYYYHLYKKNTGKSVFMQNVWKEIKRIFDIFDEWYNDNECYHYIGFLVHECERSKKPFNFKSLINLWEKSPNKNHFIEQLKGSRKIGIEGFSSIKQIIKKRGVNDLDKLYEMEKCDSKTASYPLLLLFNIQSIVDKNNMFKSDGKFETLNFERFPFNLFKKEKGWDIEHIAPNTSNSLPTENDRLLYLEYVRMSTICAELKAKINDYCCKHKDDDQKEKPSDNGEFDQLRKEIESGTLVDTDRNKVWNFCLLDQSTNRSYGNSIFALKRKEILYRERGLDSAGQPLADDLKGRRRVFIPNCTLNAFTKFYSVDAKDLSVWSIEDARNYRKAIFQELKCFGVKYTDYQLDNK